MSKKIACKIPFLATILNWLVHFSLTLAHSLAFLLLFSLSQPSRAYESYKHVRHVGKEGSPDPRSEFNDQSELVMDELQRLVKLFQSRFRSLWHSPPMLPLPTTLPLVIHALLLQAGWYIPNANLWVIYVVMIHIQSIAISSLIPVISGKITALLPQPVPVCTYHVA